MSSEGREAEFTAFTGNQHIHSSSHLTNPSVGKRCVCTPLFSSWNYPTGLLSLVWSPCRLYIPTKRQKSDWPGHRFARLRMKFKIRNRNSNEIKITLVGRTRKICGGPKAKNSSFQKFSDSTPFIFPALAISPTQSNLRHNPACDRLLTTTRVLIISCFRRQQSTGLLQICNRRCFKLRRLCNLTSPPVLRCYYKVLYVGTVSVGCIVAVVVVAAVITVGSYHYVSVYCYLAEVIRLIAKQSRASVPSTDLPHIQIWRRARPRSHFTPVAFTFKTSLLH